MEVGSFLHPHFPAFSIEQINFCQWDDPFNQQPIHAVSIEDMSNQAEYLKNLANILTTMDNSGTSKVVLSIKKELVCPLLFQTRFSFRQSLPGAMVKSTIITFNGTREKPGLAFLPRYICKNCIATWSPNHWQAPLKSTKWKPLLL